MAKTQTQLLTAQHYRQLPPSAPRCQLIDGDLIMAPAPNRFHQDVVRNLVLIIGSYLRAHPVGRIYPAPFDVYLDEFNVVQPDLTYVSRHNAKILTEEGVQGAPDLVVEILSPATAKLDTSTKRALYARTGVREYWIVDPVLRQVLVHDLAHAPQSPPQSVGDKDILTTDLLPGLTIKLAELFAG